MAKEDSLFLPSASPSTDSRSHLQGDHDGVGMRLQVPAALAALGPHEVLKLGNLFVEAIDVLRRAKRKTVNKGVLGQCLSLRDSSSKDDRVEVTNDGEGISKSDQKGLLGWSKLRTLLQLSPCKVEPEDAKSGLIHF